VPRLAAHNLIGELNLTSMREPSSFTAVEQDAAWQAMMWEINSVEQSHTWELADLLQGHGCTS
jgi:hypothetical protein